MNSLCFKRFCSDRAQTKEQRKSHEYWINTLFQPSLCCMTVCVVCSLCSRIIFSVVLLHKILMPASIMDYDLIGAEFSHRAPSVNSPSQTGFIPLSNSIIITNPGVSPVETSVFSSSPQSENCFSPSFLLFLGGPSA